jgi:hypothetical protein
VAARPGFEGCPGSEGYCRSSCSSRETDRSVMARIRAARGPHPAEISAALRVEPHSHGDQIKDVIGRETMQPLCWSTAPVTNEAELGAPEISVKFAPPTLCLSGRRHLAGGTRVFFMDHPSGADPNWAMEAPPHAE